MIKIHKTITNTLFLLNNELLSQHSFRRCAFCGSYLKDVYVDMINRLKQNNLLDENYKMRCCCCYDKNTQS